MSIVTRLRARRDAGPIDNVRTQAVPRRDEHKSRLQKVEADKYAERMRVLAEIEQEIDTTSKYAEVTRDVRLFVARQLATSKIATLGVISANPSEGRTTVALLLASALTEVHERVVFVETERNPALSLAEMVTHPAEDPPGFLVNDDAPDESDMDAKPGLRLLSIDCEGESLSPLQTVSRMQKLLKAVRTTFDFSIVDVPPLLTSEEGPSIINDVDGVVLVVTAGKTNTSDIEKALSLCTAVPILGIIVNKAAYKTPRWAASLFGSEGVRGII